MKKYIHIYEQIKEKIINGTYKINSYLPDGKTLATTYDASVLTVNKALDKLVAEGYILKRRGDGTIVKDWKNTTTGDFTPLTGVYSHYGDKVHSQVLAFEIIKASTHVANKLSICAHDFVYEIRRLRIIEGIPTIIETTYMPIDVITDLKLIHLENSIYAYIKEELKLKIQSSFFTIKGAVASPEEKALLEIDTEMVMQVEGISNLDDGRIFEYTITKHRMDKFIFQTMVFNS